MSGYASLKETLKTPGEVDFIIFGTDSAARMNDSTYDDLSFTFVGRRLSSTVGTVDMDWDKNCVVFQKSGSLANRNDRVQGSEPYMHYFKASQDESDLITIYPHFHWHQYNDTDQYIVSVAIRIKNNGKSYKEDWIDATTYITTTCDGNDVFPFSLDAGADFMEQITTFTPITAYINLSAEIEMMFTRTDGSTFTHNLYVPRFDIHCPIDKIGSRNPYNDNE